MKEAVIIKSFPNGIALYLNPELPFGSATMALSIGGRTVTDMEEIRILEAIRDNSGLNIACIVEKDDTVNQNYVKALERTERELAKKPEGQFFRGSLRDGAILETENSIIMLGDVYPGSAIISAKNIIILGGLYGKAHAGGNGREGAFVAAFEMEPERIRIGDFKYRPNTRKPKRGIRHKVQPKIAYIENDRIIFDTLTKDLLSSF